jgi:hypothetical protein
MHRALLVPFLLCSLAACPGGTPEPTPEPSPARPETDLLRYYEDNPGQALKVDTETTVSSVRFWVDTPAHIWGLRFYFSKVEEPTEAVVSLWPDFGYNYFDYRFDAPLWTDEVVVRRADFGEPYDIWFDEPFVLRQSGLVYAGIHRAADSALPDLVLDRSFDNAQADPGAYPQSMRWYPDRGRDAGGFAAIEALPSNLMVGLHLERIDVLEDSELWFEALSTSEVQGASRVAFGDYDRDGDPDLLAGARLYRNDDGRFTEVSVSAGLDGIGCGGSIWGDYDNDGWPDFFCQAGADRLLRNRGDGTFEDVTAASGIDDSTSIDCDGNGEVVQHLPTQGAGWGDYDADGDLDLYQANYECGSTYGPDKLWRNEGDGTFSDVSDAAGISGRRAGRGVNWGDYDNDGDADIFVSNYRLQRNHLWTNNGDGTFSDEANAQRVGGNFQGGWYGHTIGSLWDDMDFDGDLDLFSANLAHPRFYDFSDPSMILENQGGVFAQHQEGSGMAYRETSSSPAALDLDNDGDRDLFVTNVYEGRPPEVYEWLGDWTVRDVHYQAGLRQWNTWGVAAADVDGDGWVDLVMQQVYRNRGLKGAGNGWIKVRLVGSGAGATNTMAIGARAYVTAQGKTQMREVSGGHGTTCQDEATMHFGLGSAETADLRIVFPNTETEIVLSAESAGVLVEVHEDGTVLRR